MTETEILAVTDVGPDTVAIELKTPAGFNAEPGQFVLIQQEVAGEMQTSHYTLSSPAVTESYEITVQIDPEGTLGPWLADQEVGQFISIEGPYGDIQYSGGDDVTVLAGGPGIGPAVGIAERARSENQEANVLYWTGKPVHKSRLDQLEKDGAQVALVSDSDELAATLGDIPNSHALYAFGYSNFVDEVRDALDHTGHALADIEIESFGPA